jgi:iron complex transport system ATP-binding protein
VSAEGAVPGSDRPPLVEIRNATVWRGSTRVFKDFSLTIAQGECVAILGPNGSGKTTLLKLINRDLYPVAAEGSELRILGRSRWNVWDLRRHIGLVSPDLQSGFLPSSRVLEAILSGFFSSIGVHAQLWEEVEDWQIERAEAVMDELGLHALRKRAFDTLSTGQQRRCLLGRALVHDPDTLVLDEPTAGLDMAAGFQHMARVRALAARGRNLVLVTHQLDEIPPEVERVVLLKAGAVVADGSKASVLTGQNLSELYGTPIRVSEIDGHFLAYPGPAA